MRAVRASWPVGAVRPTRIGPTLAGATALFPLAAIVSIGWLIAQSRGAPDLVPILVAAGALCVLGLSSWRTPSVAWLAATTGMFATASLPIGLAQGADPARVGIASWLTWAVPAGLGALLTLFIAAGYATRPERRLEPAPVIAMVLLGWSAIAVAVTLVAVAAGEREDPAFTWVDVASVPIAWFRPILAVLVGLGVAADVRDAHRRARARLSHPSSAWELGSATIRELVPGQAAAEESRAAEERTRLAGDLHASVIPSLRRAIQEAEGGAEPGAVLRHLRAADLELERLMADRWPIVLETFGLVAALEELAERLEADGAPPISISVERADGRPPEAVERAAWRFAQVTLDNAIRHAAAATIDVTIASESGRVHLEVGDDGRGLDPGAPGRPAGRGLADASRRAAEVGGRATVGQGPMGGTTVRFDWPAPPG